MASEVAGRVVGIDLGTTFSALALPAAGATDLVAVDGDRICPSVVGWDREAGWLVGRPALHRAIYDPAGTIRSVKREMGTDRVYSIGPERLTPEQVSARILTRLLDAAEASTGVRPERAVVTIPAYFGQSAREATRRAAEAAGLDVLRLLHEPTAAALLHRPDGGQRQVLVFDLGGGTFDASLVRQDGGLLEVVASHGDTRLGGDDFDLLLAGLLLEAHTGGDDAAAGAIRDDPVAWTRLLLAAEAAKRRLSSEVETTVRIEFLADGHLETTVTRTDYEVAIAPLLARTLDSIERVLADARVGFDDLDEILLVGGSTRTPAVWNLLADESGREPSMAIDPDEAVALGAGIEAGTSAGLVSGRVLVDACPFSLGVAALGDSDGPRRMRCRTITPRNAPIPSRHVERFQAITPDQRRAELYLFQGGDPDPTRNQCLGRIEIEGLGRREIDFVPEIRVALEYDLDGVVRAEVVDGTGRARVGGSFRADGGSAERMAEYIAHCEEDGIVPGAGPPADRAEPDEATAGPERPGPDRPGPDRSDLDDYRADATTIAAGLADIAAKHPAAADALRAALDALVAALDREDGPAARAAHEELADLLFDLGVFV